MLHIATNCAVIYYISTDEKYERVEAEHFYRTNAYGVFIGLLALAIFFNILATLFLGHLISFHIFLQAKKLTTFEYLQIKQNKGSKKSKIFREVHKDQESGTNKQDEGGDLLTDNVNKDVPLPKLADDETLIKIEGHHETDRPQEVLSKTFEISESEHRSKSNKVKGNRLSSIYCLRKK